jgi:hypothetical protein
MTQLFTRSTALLNFAVWIAALIGSIAGPLWLAVAGWTGALVVMAWTVIAARRAGHNPFPDQRSGPEERQDRRLSDEES